MTHIDSLHGYVKCRHGDQLWCTHVLCRVQEEARISKMPLPPHDRSQEKVEIRDNGAGQREYRVVQYTEWRVVPEP